MRLIDADALKKWIADRVKNYHKSFPDWRKTHPISVETALLELDCIKDVVRESPTIDAAPVVRCGECGNWQRDWACTRGESGDHYCAVLDNVFPPDFYCKYGAKMDAEEGAES